MKVIFVDVDGVLNSHKTVRKFGPNFIDPILVGLVERFGMEPVFCYDKQAIVAKIMREEGIHFEQAAEHFEYNIVGAWVGKGTPCFLTRHIDCCLVHHED